MAESYQIKENEVSKWKEQSKLNELLCCIWRERQIVNHISSINITQSISSINITHHENYKTLIT